MSWANRLIETYDNYFRDGAPGDDPTPLVPVGFSAKKIGIRVNLYRDGTFASAQILENDVFENIPSTPEAEGRTGPPVPYPLIDELRYIAGDLSEYAKVDYRDYSRAYEAQLRGWAESSDSSEELRIILRYIAGKTLAGDLLESGLVRLDKEGFFPAKYVQLLVSFDLFNGVSSFVPIAGQSSVIQSWQSFIVHRAEGSDLSYADGGYDHPLYNHAKIEGNAKLMSQKESGMSFQFRGRFETPEQAYAVSYMDSAKISNTIRWLRNRGAFRKYGMTFLTWSTKAKNVIPPLDEDEPEEIVTDTAEAYAEVVRDKMSGVRHETQYGQNAAVVLLGLETATPGRMSVTYYEELGGEQYLDMLERWYLHCAWLLCRNHKETKQMYRTYATPTPWEIGTAVYGAEAVIAASRDKRLEKSATKLMKKLCNDLVICIVNGRAVPNAYSLEAYKRTCNPNSFTDSSGKWQRISWEKSMAVTLAMLKSSFEKEEYQVALDKECTDRSYLFGRLIAVADTVESRAMSGTDSGWRQTNAVRYFSAMQQRPAVTWQTVETKLVPYYKQLREKGGYYAHLADEIYLLGKPEEMSMNTPLSPKFLEGYHNQRYELNKKKEN